MILVHDTLLEQKTIYAQGATGDWAGVDGAYCLDAPDTHPAGSTRRVEPRNGEAFAISRSAYRAGYQ